MNQMPRGRKRTHGEADSDPVSQMVDLAEVESRDAVLGRSVVDSEDHSQTPSDPVLKTREVGGKSTFSSEGRLSSKRQKLNPEMQSSKRSCIVRETCQFDTNVEEVETKEINKSSLITCERSGDSARRQSIEWKLRLEPALKKILERDMKIVTKEGKRHMLPASPNIIQLLNQFVKDASRRRLSALEKLQTK